MGPRKVLGTCLPPAIRLDKWLGSITCPFRSALVSVVSFHVVVGPSLLDGTAPFGGPDAGQVLQRGQPDTSLVRVLSYGCTAKNMSRPMDHQTPSKEAATVAAVRDFGRGGPRGVARQHKASAGFTPEGRVVKSFAHRSRGDAAWSAWTTGRHGSQEVATRELLHRR